MDTERHEEFEECLIMATKQQLPLIRSKDRIRKERIGETEIKKKNT